MDNLTGSDDDSETTLDLSALTLEDEPGTPKGSHEPLSKSSVDLTDTSALDTALPDTQPSFCSGQSHDTHQQLQQPAGHPTATTEPPETDSDQPEACANKFCDGGLISDSDDDALHQPKTDALDKGDSDKLLQQVKDVTATCD